MSRDIYIRIGWYATFIPNVPKKAVSTKEVRGCLGSSKHKVGKGKFCSTCGSKVGLTSVAVYKEMGSVLELTENGLTYYTSRPELLAAEYFGRVTQYDLEVLDGSKAVTLHNQNSGAEVVAVLAPGFIDFEDAKYAGQLNPIDPGSALAEPSQAWRTSLTRIFNASEFKVAYGLVIAYY